MVGGSIRRRERAVPLASPASCWCSRRWHAAGVGIVGASHHERSADEQHHVGERRLGPDGADPRSGSWFTCSGTLLNDHRVSPRGPTYATRGGVSTTANGGSGSGGTDMWISSRVPELLDPAAPSPTARPRTTTGPRARCVPRLAPGHRVPAPRSSTQPHVLPAQRRAAQAAGAGADEPIRRAAEAASWTSSKRHDEPGTLLHGRRLRAEQGPAERLRSAVIFRFAGTVHRVTLRGLFGLPSGTAARFTNNNTHGSPGACFGDSAADVLRPDQRRGHGDVVGISPNCTGS